MTLVDKESELEINLLPLIALNQRSWHGRIATTRTPAKQQNSSFVTD